MSTEIEALEQFFTAINRNDMQAITKDFDPQIVRIEPESFQTAGTYRGIAEVQARVTKGRGTWAEGTCQPEQFLVNGDKVVVYLEKLKAGPAHGDRSIPKTSELSYRLAG